MNNSKPQTRFTMSALRYEDLQSLRRHISKNNRVAPKFYGWLRELVVGELARRLELDQNGVENVPAVVGDEPLYTQLLEWTNEELRDASIACSCLVKATQRYQVSSLLDVIEGHLDVLIFHRLLEK